jgi:hypothetical protein
MQWQCTSIVNGLYMQLDQSDYDRFSKALISCTLPAKTTLPLLRDVIRAEFEKNKTTPGAIMRGNTAATKLMGLYCRTSCIATSLAPLPSPSSPHTDMHPCLM